MTNVCLNLVANPELEEALLDQLLLNPNSQVFVSQSCASHGGHLADFNPLEQVLGRAQAVKVQVFLANEQAQVLIADLRQLFSGTGLRYWLSPLLEEGEF